MCKLLSLINQQHYGNIRQTDTLSDINRACHIKKKFKKLICSDDQTMIHTVGGAELRARVTEVSGSDKKNSQLISGTHQLVKIKKKETKKNSLPMKSVSLGNWHKS